MNINLIRYALEVNRYGSINKAAKALFISQSTISKGLKDLEKDLGFTLFTRTSRGIIPTRLGQIFLHHAEELDNSCRIMEDLYFGNHSPSRTNTPSILTMNIASTFCAVSARAMIDVINHHKKEEFKNVCLIETHNDDVIQKIASGQSNIGILVISEDAHDTYMNRFLAADMDSFCLPGQQLCLQVGPDHPLAREKSVTLDQLTDYPHAARVKAEITPFYYCSGVQNYDYKSVTKRILVSDRAALYDLLRHTDAYRIGADMGDSSYGTADIRYIPIEDADSQMEYIFIWQKLKPPTPAESEFIDVFTKMIRSINNAESCSEAENVR